MNLYRKSTEIFGRQESQITQSGGGAINSMIAKQTDSVQRQTGYELNTIWQNNGGVGDEIKAQENAWMGLVGVSKNNKND
jgi:hypothetical protein